ncbi:ester cyclase [Flavihumibacter sp. ZG627]|uniref:ester cyclase n=1 Tax=Flavihumibacter sp. ZG627 TaxID=1463156 RepID=UPI00057EBFB2|nr:ester cyclase [Flavihumibacter sp. ZG627]KIC89915.1 polyketide cyclase [Flavihumibacter sp. ZG627]
MKRTSLGLIFSALLAIIMLVACNDNQKASDANDESKDVVATTSDTDQLTQERLRRFDSLDFQFYNNQKWDSFSVSHADNIKVYYPDGTVTSGIYPDHIDKLTPLFAFAPDTKITKHPVSFGSGDWTAVIGEMEGTFSKPMDIGNGKSIPPTGKKFKITMSTIAHWEGGKMIEEYLHWDNYAMMKQIGVAQ